MESTQERQVVAYGRVSSREQAENQHAAKQQQDRLLSYGVNRLYFDVESGASDKRSDYNRMLQAMDAGEIRQIVATRLDRITRDAQIFLDLKSSLIRNDVELYCLDGGKVDLTTAAGELSVDIQATMAEHERRMLRERVLRGHEYRRKRQVAWTRAPFGYTIKHEKYVLDQEPIICLLEQQPDNYQDFKVEPNRQTELPSLIAGLSRADIAADAIQVFKEVRKARKTLTILYQKYGVICKPFISKKKQAHLLDGETSDSLQQTRTNLVLADELLLWSAGQGLTTWLENPILRGHTAYRKYSRGKGKIARSDWEIHEDTHSDQRLLTDEEFHDIELTLQTNRRCPCASNTKFNLTGFIYCNRCGHKMVLKRSNTFRYYGCRHSTLGCSNRKCIRTEILEEAIAIALFRRALKISQNNNSHPSEASESLELKGLRQQLAVIEQAQANTPSDALKRARHEIETRIEQILQQSDLLSFERASAIEILSHPQARDLGFWHTRTYTERATLYSKLIQKVNVLEQNITSIDLKV